MEIKGGDKLAAKLAEIGHSVQSSHTLKVGFLAGSTEADGTPVPLVAAINEFGAPSRGQPPRPFFRRMIAEKSKGWPDQLSNLLKQNDMDAHTALEFMGEGIKGQLQESITSFTDPPLSPKTVKRKGFSKALIETGTMLNSIGVEVK